ncbi:MAG: antitoxin family protein [Acidobacteriota bacterium]
MTKQVEAVYQNGMLRPLQPLALEENQRVTVAVSDLPEDPLGAFLDHEYMEEVREEVEAMDYVPSHEEVRKITSKDPASWAEYIIAEREDRF